MVSSRVVSIIKYILAFLILISISKKNPLKETKEKAHFLGELEGINIMSQGHEAFAK